MEEFDPKKFMAKMSEMSGKEPGEILNLLNESAGDITVEKQPVSDWGAALKAIADGGNKKGSDPLAVMAQIVAIKEMRKVMSGEDEKPKEDIAKLINDALEKQATGFQKTLDELKASQIQANHDAEIAELKRMFEDGSGKKNDALLDKFDSLNEKLEAEKEKRMLAAIEGKDKEMLRFREDVQGQFDNLMDTLASRDSHQTSPLDFMDKTVRDMKRLKALGKELGMNDEDISEEGLRRPIKESIVRDLFKTVNRAIDRGVFGGGTEGEYVDDDELAALKAQKDAAAAANEPELIKPGLKRIITARHEDEKNQVDTPDSKEVS